MPKPPNTRTKTRPGLGLGDDLTRADTMQIERVRGEAGGESGEQVKLPEAPAAAPPSRRLRETLRREEERDDAPIPSAPFRSEAPSGTRERPRSNRPAVAVDQVGHAAMKIARSHRPSTPSLVASRSVIAKAPIDSRSAFVLSLVDGQSTTSAIVDAAGMPDEDVRAILDRLARLGLISLR